MKFTLAAILFVIPVAAHAETLDAILARMDRAARNFQSVTADFSQVDYTAVLKDTSTPVHGALQIKRNKGTVSAILNFEKPDDHTILIKGGKAYMYYPKAKHEDIYSTGKYGALVDQYVLLAFGTSGAELHKNFQIKLGGTENVAGKPATRIELVPTGTESKKVISKVELWILEGQSNAIQEKVTKDSDDYYLATYSNVKYVKVDDSVFNLKVPPGTAVVTQH